MQFIFFLFFFIGLSETALRAPVTMLSSEEKPCYLQSGAVPLNKQQLLSGCRIYIQYVPVRMYIRTRLQGAKQTHPLRLSTMPRKAGNGYANSPDWCLLSGSWLCGSSRLLPNYRRGYWTPAFIVNDHKHNGDMYQCQFGAVLRFITCGNPHQNQ